LPLYPLNELDRRLDTEDSIVKGSFFDQEKGEDSLISLLKRGDETWQSEETNPTSNQNTSSGFALFADLFRNIKENLERMKSFAHLSREKFGDAEYGDYFCKTISEDIAKTGAVLNSLANYLKINSPLPGTNTVRFILEETLKSYEDTLQEKKIRVFKKQFAENLPETSLHEEQLRFILNSILQYAVPSTPPRGRIGFLVRSFDGDKPLLQRDEKYIEILAGFTGYQNESQLLESTTGYPVSPQKVSDDFILHLAKEIIGMNRGSMEIRVDDEKLITLISLVLPTEKRMMPHCQATVA